MKFEEISLRKKGYRSFGEDVMLTSEYMFTNTIGTMLKFKRCLSSVVIEMNTVKFFKHQLCPLINVWVDYEVEVCPSVQQEDIVLV